MVRYEYSLLVFTWRTFFHQSCEGHAVTAPTRDEAQRQLRDLLRPSLAGRQAERRRVHLVAEASFQDALAEWRKRFDEIAATYRVEVVEETLGTLDRTQAAFRQAVQSGIVEIGSKEVQREKVTLPDGSTRMFELGSGAEYVEARVAETVGDAPTPPEQPVGASDAELLDELLESAGVQEVGRWIGQIMPADDAFDSEPFAGSLSSRVATELNRLGADGWQLADLSEDRAIVSGASGTESAVVAARYTLIREIVE